MISFVTQAGSRRALRGEEHAKGLGFGCGESVVADDVFSHCDQSRSCAVVVNGLLAELSASQSTTSNSDEQQSVPEVEPPAAIGSFCRLKERREIL